MTESKPVSQDLVDAFESYLNVLPLSEREISGLGIDRTDVLSSFKAQDEKSKYYAGLFLSSTRDEMVDAGIENPSEEDVLAATVKDLKDATRRLTINKAYDIAMKTPGKKYIRQTSK